MFRLHHTLLILPLILAACATTPAEPATFNVELISFEADKVVEPVSGMPILVPGYWLKLRRGALIDLPKNPDRTSYNVALMDCDREEYIYQSTWVCTGDQLDPGSTIVNAPFYKYRLASLELPKTFCGQVLIGNGKAFTKVKHPILISNKVQLELPNE